MIKDIRMMLKMINSRILLIIALTFITILIQMTFTTTRKAISHKASEMLFSTIT